jgi:pimeloyl-ACP methyl ester carboxylesterase
VRLAAIVGLTTAGSAASAGTVVLVAAASGSLALSVTGGLVCAVAAAWTGSAVARRRHDGPQGVLTRRILGPVVVFGCIAVVSASWLWPGLGAVRPAAAPGATWLSRPDGSRLAVHVTRAATATDPPLIVVHGGPGVADMAHDVEAFAALATTRDVYIYDQVGAGASTRLTDPDGYTTARAVEDLEAVRVATGSERVALLGHSWGARVVTAYLAAHSSRVTASVLSAPGEIPVGTGTPAGSPADRLGPRERVGLYLTLARPRNLFTYAVTAADPRVAHRLASDREMDRRFTRIYRRTTSALFCDPLLGDRLGTDGVGFYAHQVPQLHPDKTPPVDRAALGSVTAPVLVVKPACDYLPWRFAVDYRDALPNARLVMLPNAGHQAYLEQPTGYAGVVLAFLAGRDLPLPTVTGSGIPAGYRGIR